MKVIKLKQIDEPISYLFPVLFTSFVIFRFISNILKFTVGLALLVRIVDKLCESNSTNMRRKKDTFD